MKQRLILIGAGLLLLVVVVRLITSRPGGGEEVAVDTTGASAVAGAAGHATPGAAGTPAPAAATSVPKPTGPTPTPVVVQIQGTAVSVATKPLLLLNPSTVRQGSSVGVTGSGFDPGATVDIYVKEQEADSVDPLTFVQVDKSGGFGGVTFAVPDTLPRGSFIVEADQRESDNQARATAVIAGGSPQVKLGTQAAKSGDTVQLSAAGFGPDEDINVYWNDLSSDVIGTLHTDDAGGLRQGAVRVPFGAVGNNAFIFVGTNSEAPVTVPFQMLNLYPSVDLSSYAIKPDNVLSFSGKDFGPDEQVRVFLNNPDGPPLTTIQADETGGFTNSGGFLVPFGLQGKQTLIFMGSQSKAPTTASFDLLPYTPSAQPSTYGGRPGTTLTFYAIGFARNEIVHAFVGRTQESAGTEVSCFQTDPQGNAASGGSYVVPGDASPGQLIFSLIGSRSQAAATAALEVIASDVPVQVPPQAPFACDLTDAPDAPQVVGVVDAPPAAAGDLTSASTMAPSRTPAVQANVLAAPSPTTLAQASSAGAAPKPAAPATAPAMAAAKPSPTSVGTAGTKAKATPTPLGKGSTTAKASPTPKASGAAKPAPTGDTTVTPTAAAAATSATAAPAAPATNPTQAPSPTTAPAEPAAAVGPQTYTIQSGDTLPSIASQVYGDANQWTTIYDANRSAIGDDPNLLKVGTQLTIPAKESR